MGANKTEKSIIKISKVAPVIQAIAQNVVSMSETADYHTHHKARSAEVDLREILSVLDVTNPWKLTPGRQSGFPGISESPFTFNQDQLKSSIATNVVRLKKGIMLLAEPEEPEEVQE